MSHVFVSYYDNVKLGELRAHVAKSHMQTRQNTTEPERWGLSLEDIMGLQSRLSEYYDRYRPYLMTQTDDTSDYGFHYLSGLMRMETKRTMANIARTSGVPIQNMQQFISDSPWSGPRRGARREW